MQTEAAQVAFDTNENNNGDRYNNGAVMPSLAAINTTNNASNSYGNN